MFHQQGPISEEFLFRACLLPIMVPTFGWRAAVCFCPVFFGLGKSALGGYVIIIAVHSLAAIEAAKHFA